LPAERFRKCKMRSPVRRLLPLRGLDKWEKRRWRMIAKGRPSLYLDLKASADRTKLAEPALFLGNYEDRLVIFDGIQRVPELFQALRGLIARGRRHGRKSSRFLILGSASVDLLKQSSESLAGRIAYVEMEPLDELETAAAGNGANQRWVRGGFP